MLRFMLYALRWQLSTPILWPIVSRFGTDLWAVVLANFIGSSIFFWVDRFIFSPRVQEWELLRFGKCSDCGRYTAVRRLSYDPRGYDRRDDPNPEYRCKTCSAKKLAALNLK